MAGAEYRDGPTPRQVVLLLVAIACLSAAWTISVVTGEREAPPPAAATRTTGGGLGMGRAMDPADRQVVLTWRALRDGDVERAERLATEVVLERPDDGVGWFAMGGVRHAQQRYEEAIACYLRVLPGAPPPARARAVYNIACAHARLGRDDDALTTLREAIDAGFRRAGFIEADPDLASLRDDGRFRALLARTSAASAAH